MRNKVEFEVEKDGAKRTLSAVRPKQSVLAEADLVRSKRWGELARTPGVLLESALKDVVRQKGVWDDEKQKRLEEIDKRLAENEARLPDANGKVRQKGVRLSDLRKAAVQMRLDRMERVRLLSEFTSLRNNTAEGMADDERFNFLVSRCVVDERGNPHFASLDDYKERAHEPDASAAATAVMQLLYDHDPDFARKLPENRFLLRYRMCREDLALTGPDGVLVDVDGKPVDEDGNPLLPEQKAEEPESFDLEPDEWAAEAVAPAPEAAAS
jgi:hypothetical protein